MTKRRQAERLATRIEKDDPRCQITNIRHHDSGYYSVAAVDTRTGYPFVVTCAEDWEERLRAAGEAAL